MKKVAIITMLSMLLGLGASCAFATSTTDVGISAAYSRNTTGLGMKKYKKSGLLFHTKSRSKFGVKKQKHKRF